MSRLRVSFFTMALLIIMLVFGGCGGGADDKALSHVTIGNWADTADTSWYNASQSNFTISTANQLAGMAKLINNGTNFSGKTVTLTKNINLSGREWTPITGIIVDNGLSFSRVSFEGTFDGSGHVISNMTITKNENVPIEIGLFGFTGGTIKNVKLTSMYIKIDDTNHSFAVGGIVGEFFAGALENCVSSGSIIISTDSSAPVGSVGGIVGNNIGNVTDCAFDGSIFVSSGTSCVGGVAGNVYGTVANCTSNGEISISSDFAIIGGITGSSHGEVINCASKSNIIVTSSNTIISSSYYSYVGGVVGELMANVASNCTSDGEITVNLPSSNYVPHIGGIVGKSDDFCTITNNKSNGRVSSSSSSAYIGGVIGTLLNTGNLISPTVISGNTYNKATTGQQWGIGYDFRVTPPGPSDDV